MLLRDAFLRYIQQVSAQLRWKRARPSVERELAAHLCDQYEALVAAGMSEAEAEAETLLRMGDAVDIGTRLDRVHRPKPHWGLFLLTGTLLALGLLIHLFVTYDSDYGYRLTTHLIGAVLGLGALFGAYYLDYTLLARHPLPAYLALAALLPLSMAGGFLVNGYHFYTAHLTLLLPLGYTALLYALRNKGFGGLLLSILGFLLSAGLCLLAPSVSGLVTMLVSGLVLLAVALAADWFAVGRRRGLWSLAGLTALGLGCAALFLLSQESLQQRFLVALFPELDPNGAGWMGLVIRELLTGAQLIGPGSTGQYTSALPTGFIELDYLLTWLIHRFGWIVLAVVLPLFAVFFTLAFRACLRQKALLGRLVSLSVTLTLLCETVLYSVSNLGLLLVRGISLPLVSLGNTALVLNMALIGVMLSVFRAGFLAEDPRPHPAGAAARRIRLENGTLTISFR